METIEINGKKYNLDVEKAKEMNILTEKKPKPKSWQEYVESVDMDSNAPSLKGSKEEILLSMFQTQEEAKAFNALNKLIILRDIWWDGWQPEFMPTTYDGIEYGCIYRNVNGDVKIFMTNSRPTILTFETSDIAQEFFDTYKDLIEQAKMFL